MKPNVPASPPHLVGSSPVSDPGQEMEDMVPAHSELAPCVVNRGTVDNFSTSLTGLLGGSHELI